VKYLQGINFAQLFLAETTEIKNLVCLITYLVITQSSLNRIQTYVRKFIPAIYKINTRHAVAHLGEALRYKPEGRGFDS
jgi:hypothetical protein